MMTLRLPTLLFVAVFSAAAVLALSAVGCGGGSADGTTSGLPGQPGQPGQPVVDNGGDARFDVSEVNADRYSAKCGVADPPFAPSDQLTLRAIGTKGMTPYPLLTITLLGSTPSGMPLTLTPDPWQAGETVIGMSQQAGGPVVTIMGARSETAHGGPSDTVRLDLSRGADATYVDATAFTDVTVTVVALPQKSGDALTIRVAFTFSDGKRLDETFSAPMAPSNNGCPAG